MPENQVQVNGHLKNKNNEPSPKEKEELIVKLRDIAKKEHNLTPKQIEYCNDTALDIHLRARKWDLDKSTQILNESLQWVKEHEDLLTNLKCPGCVENPRSHYFKDMGLDKFGRPVIYTTAGGYFPDISLKYCYEHNIIAFENALHQMKNGVERFVYIADMFNIGYQNMDLKTNISFFKTIQAPYRGRLGQIILVDPPSTIWVAFKVIKPFLKPETLEKVMFVKTSEVRSKLTDILGPESTEKLALELEENHNQEKARAKRW